MRALTLPLARRNPARIPRRDLVLVAGDGLHLAVTLVEEDRPDAEPVDLSGLGPRLRLAVWRAGSFSSIWGIVSPTVPGRVDIAVPYGSTTTVAGEATFEIQAEIGGIVVTLCRGSLQLLPGPAMGDDSVDVLDDYYSPVLGDDYRPVEV